MVLKKGLSYKNTTIFGTYADERKNDCAVMYAYGMPVKGTTESSCVAELMRRYKEIMTKK